jgi:kynurenine formamidase
MTTAADGAGAPAFGRAEFDALYRRLRGMARWGRSDRRGALNHITPATVMAAATEVRSGRTVSLASPMETDPSLDNPEPNRHDMTSGPDGGAGAGLRFAKDSFHLHVHGDADSHIDALCHVIYDGELYNGVSAATVTPAGASALSIELASAGIVGRGVLLDVARLRGVPWLDPGDHVTGADLEAAEAAEAVRVRPGDLLFVRVGHRQRRDAMGPWRVADARAGLHPTAIEFVADRGVAVLGSDGNNDTAPSSVPGVDFPVHVLAVQALGLHLLDYLQFIDLTGACEAEGRWSFLCVIAPLRLPSATGSPINPIAVL